MAKKVALYTLGCKLNQVDTEAIRESFERAGYISMPFDSEADVYVVNTCTVTGKTDHQARQMLRRAIRRKEARPDIKVVVTGCYAQTRPDALRDALPELDLIVGNLDKERVPQLLNELEAGDKGAVVCVPDVFEERQFRPMSIETFSDYTRAFLRIQEGCNSRCAYCIVPYARGRSRSASPEEVLKQAEQFAASGYREIVIVGIHIGRYGEGLTPRTTLADLLLRLREIEDICRIRLSSIDPKEFTPELFDALDTVRSKLCPHFHISLQSGDNEILRSMRRNYTTDDFSGIVGQLRNLFPDVSIGADIIVGFPGETSEAFEATYRFVREQSLSYLHIFRYSQRPGTPAVEMPNQVQEEIKKLRSRRLHDIRRVLNREFRERFIDGEIEVLLENRRVGKKKRLTGLTRNYLRVFGDGPDELMGNIVSARIASLARGGLEADKFTEL